MLKKDRVLHAQAALHLQQGDPAAAQAIIRSNCFPTYGSDRGRLIAMWETSHMMQEEKTKGRPLTLFEQVHPLPCMAHPCMTHPTPTEKGRAGSEGSIMLGIGLHRRDVPIHGWECTCSLPLLSNLGQFGTPAYVARGFGKAAQTLFPLVSPARSNFWPEHPTVVLFGGGEQWLTLCWRNLDLARCYPLVCLSVLPCAPVQGVGPQAHRVPRRLLERRRRLPLQPRAAQHRLPIRMTQRQMWPGPILSFTGGAPRSHPFMTHHVWQDTPPSIHPQLITHNTHNTHTQHTHQHTHKR